MADKRLVRLDSHHAAQVLGELASRVGSIPRGMDMVVVRALNRAVTATRDEVSRAIRAEYAVPARDVKNTMYVRKATRVYKVGILYARGKMSIPLIRWGARQTKKGVTVLIRKGGGRKRVVSKDGQKLPGVFIAKGEVYARQTARRTPIRRLYGPSFLAYFGKPEVIAAQQARAEDVFRTRVIAEANYLLSKELAV